MEAERQRLVSVISQCDAESERLGQELQRRTSELEDLRAELMDAVAARTRERTDTVSLQDAMAELREGPPGQPGRPRPPAAAGIALSLLLLLPF